MIEGAQEVNLQPQERVTFDGKCDSLSRILSHEQACSMPAGSG